MTAVALQGGSDRAPGIALRPYQLAAIAGIHDAFEANHRSTLVVAATGTGKTVTFAELARLEVSRGGRVLILVHRDELIRQARRKCEDVGLWPDVEKAKARASTLAKVVLASVQTLRGARLARWARDHFALVIVDEAHHAAATGYRTILDHFDGARVVGVTATPDRVDGKALGDVFGSVAYRYEIRQAIAEGYLVPVVARRIVVESVDLSNVATRAGDFAQDQLADVMGEEQALLGVCSPLLELARDRLTIAFCVDVAHAHAIADTLNAMRPGCAHAVSGQTDDDERERLLEAHARGDFQFLCNCEVLVEGYDSPAVSCVAMIRPTRSRGRYVQCAGRGLRPSPSTGKVDCLLLNFTGACKHKLIGPVDCLAGDLDLADDVRDEIDRLLGTAQCEIESVLAHAEDEVRRRRAELAGAAVVRFHAEHVDPFLGDEDPRDRQQRHATPSRWEVERATERQLAALEKAGVTLSKLPKTFSQADASRLLDRFARRHAQGLASYKAARALSRAGVVDTRNLTRERARELLDKLRLGGWMPSAIAMEPETRGAG
jgi:superfamily II DNA or RNA helicase